MGAWGFISLPENGIDKWQAFVFLDSPSCLMSLFLSEAVVPHCIAQGPLAFLDI